jgi:peptide/nickel transport system substrate-binding protein
MQHLNKGEPVEEIDHGRIDPIRKEAGPILEHIIDEFLGDRVTRRDFMRRATMYGMSIPVAGTILAARGGSLAAHEKPLVERTGTAPRRAAASGATINAGMIVPATALDPILIEDQGGLEVLGNIGEFLVFADQQLKYHPWLATSWKSNADATVWTFKIRQGVKFNNGKPMTVDDVVYSFKSQANPTTGGNALSVFGGTLNPDGVRKVDHETVAFHLEAPDASFVDACSEDNYNMIIVPNGYDYSNYHKVGPGFIGTNKFKMQSFSPESGCVLIRNPHHWGSAAKPEKVVVTFYDNESPMASALEAGSIDVMDQFTFAISPQILSGNFNIIKLKCALQRQLSMRCDIHPFTNKYVRQAIAFTLNRPAIIKALFNDLAVIGNDNPFYPGFPSYDHSVGQRSMTLKKAKELLAKGGVPRGFSTPLLTETTQEIPDLAEIVQRSAAQIGVDITLTIESPDKYYGDGTFGKSDWLDGEMSLVDYGARSVPNLYLEAPLQTTNKKTGAGAWNAAHFNNPTYDKLSRQFVAAADLSDQRKLAGKIETLLLDETPIIFPYFYDYLCATAKNVHGVYPTGQAQLFLWNTTKS